MFVAVCRLSPWTGSLPVASCLPRAPAPWPTAWSSRTMSLNPHHQNTLSPGLFLSWVSYAFLTLCQFFLRRNQGYRLGGLSDGVNGVSLLLHHTYTAVYLLSRKNLHPSCSSFSLSQQSCRTQMLCLEGVGVQSCAATTGSSFEATTSRQSRCLTKKLVMARVGYIYLFTTLSGPTPR